MVKNLERYSTIRKQTDDFEFVFLYNDATALQLGSVLALQQGGLSKK